jgi:hypothetical protein
MCFRNFITFNIMSKDSLTRKFLLFTLTGLVNIKNLTPFCSEWKSPIMSLVLTLIKKWLR